MIKLGIRILLITSAYLLVYALGYLGFATRQANLVGWFLILTAFAYGIGGPFLIRNHMKIQGSVRQENNDRSFWAVIPGFLVVFYVSPLEFIYISEILPGVRSTWMQIFGLFLIACSILLFSSARIALKGFYSGRLQVVEGHLLIQKGPYHLIRHPAYAAFILMSLGIFIGYSSLLALIGSVLLLVPGLIYRINVEEQLLVAEFGDEYLSYASSTKRLIPFIW